METISPIATQAGIVDCGKNVFSSGSPWRGPFIELEERIARERLLAYAKETPTQISCSTD